VQDQAYFVMITKMGGTIETARIATTKKQQSHMNSGRRLRLGEVYGGGGTSDFSSSSIGLRGHLSPLGFGFFNTVGGCDTGKMLSLSELWMLLRNEGALEAPLL
jgi:hypothetical protein